MNTYLIVAKITKIFTITRTGAETVREYLSNKYIEANTKKEALEQYNKFISEQNTVEEKITLDVQAVVLNIIEL